MRRIIIYGESNEFQISIDDKKFVPERVIGTDYNGWPFVVVCKTEHEVYTYNSWRQEGEKFGSFKELITKFDGYYRFYFFDIDTFDLLKSS